ncbi:MAG: type I restriction enzyme HsdR N-terminal domain-containing protein [Mariprofundaceae bacterium]
MASIPAKTLERIRKAVPKFKRVLNRARERDVNEADTVTIISDVLEEVFGFDKYSEITREYAIRGTYCDLAVKYDDVVRYLIEIKAIGLDLKENHLRQAVNYAAGEGIEWVVLTNGIEWEIYHVSVKGKVDHELVCAFKFTELNPRSGQDVEMLYMLCKRGIDKDLITDFYERQQVVNKFMITAIALSQPVASTIRRELRKIKPGLKVDVEEIQEILQREAFKREVIETGTAQDTISKVSRAMARAAKK